MKRFEISDLKWPCRSTMNLPITAITTITAIAATLSIGLALADTAPQELLAMIPGNACAAVVIPNLKFCSDEITRGLEGMDRANLLLGSRPLDLIKSATGFNVGINDVGGAAMVF